MYNDVENEERDNRERFTWYKMKDNENNKGGRSCWWWKWHNLRQKENEGDISDEEWRSVS